MLEYRFYQNPNRHLVRVSMFQKRTGFRTTPQVRPTQLPRRPGSVDKPQNSARIVHPTHSFLRFNIPDTLSKKKSRLQRL